MRIDQFINRYNRVYMYNKASVNKFFAAVIARRLKRSKKDKNSSKF